MLYDATGSYAATFYVAGAIIWMSGSMLFIIPCLQRLEPQQAQSSRDRQLPSTTVSAVVDPGEPGPHTEPSPNGEVQKAASLSALSASASEPEVSPVAQKSQQEPVGWVLSFARHLK